MFAFPSFPELMPEADPLAARPAPAPKPKSKKLSGPQEKKRVLLRQEVKQEVEWQSWPISQLSNPSYVRSLYEQSLKDSEGVPTLSLKPEHTGIIASLSPFGCFSLMRQHHVHTRNRLALRHAERKEGNNALTPAEIQELLAEEKEEKEKGKTSAKDKDELEEEPLQVQPVQRSTPSLDAAVAQIFRF